MIEVRRRIDAPPGRVFEVLSDGWLYPSWVVGASRMRAVDGSWPSPGARLHHSVGVWPALLNDNTEVLTCEPDARLVLRARGWPMGEATVEIELHPGDDPGTTLVVMREDVSAGPAKVMPRPLRAAAIVPRNVESLRRLAYIAENHSGDPAAGG